MHRVILLSNLMLLINITVGHSDLWYNGASSSDLEENCTLVMFNNDTNAYRACLTQVALQRNWFPSPISGLYTKSYLAWNGFDGFWQNGAVLETFANFMSYAGNRRYKDVLLKSFRKLPDMLKAYYPEPSFDDVSWYALSYIRIYEVLGDEAFLAEAQKIFDWVWQNGWDEQTCGGGFWWDSGYNAKVTITNVQMFQIGAKLNKLTKFRDSKLQDKLDKIWKWIDKTKLVDLDTFLIMDGIDDLTTCTVTYNKSNAWTYNQGVFIGGLAYFSENLPFGESFLEIAQAVATATINVLSVNGTLAENCDSARNCGDDAKMYKGIFVRNLRYLLDYVKDENLRHKYERFLKSNADKVWSHDSCFNGKHCEMIFRDGPAFYNVTSPVFDAYWSGPYNYSAPMQQTMALDLFVSAIGYPKTVCKGDGCTHNPPVPPPKSLSCEQDPCPAPQDCCDYEGQYRTCCMVGQKCVSGTCQ